LAGVDGFEPKKDLAAWIQAAQLSSGGFTYQPDPPVAGCDDVLYTLAAVDALRRLGAAPRDRDACVAYLFSLQNEDGGFGNRPGEPSCPVGTFYARSALEVLDALAPSGASSVLGPLRRTRAGAQPACPTSQGSPTGETGATGRTARRSAGTGRTEGIGHLGETRGVERIGHSGAEGVGHNGYSSETERVGQSGETGRPGRSRAR